MMQVRFVKYITSFVPFSGNQWDVAVAQGFDLSLVSFADLTSQLIDSFVVVVVVVVCRPSLDLHVQACAIVVYLGSTLYDNSKFSSSYGLEASNGPSGGHDSQGEWQLRRQHLTKVASASAALADAASASACSA